MFEWLKNLFKRSSTEIAPENVDHPDPLARQVISRAFNSGNLVIGWAKEDGTVEIKEIKDES
jgi:hypothetical protein